MNFIYNLKLAAIKHSERINKIRKIVVRVLLGALLFMLSLAILLSLPAVQTKIGSYVTEMLYEDFGADIKVEQVAISIFGGVKLKKIVIRDHKKNAFITANRIKTDILSIGKWRNGDLIFGDIRIDSLFFDLKTYKGFKESNINIFSSLFDSGQPSTKKFLLKAQNVYATNSHFILSDENNKITKTLDIKEINMSLNNFMIDEADVTTKINKMSLIYDNGLKIKNLETEFAYLSDKMLLQNLHLLTKNSFIDGDFKMSYKDGDFDNFNEKVNFNFKIDSSSLATNDLKLFYNELGKNKQFSLKTKINGPLDNLFFKNLKLIEKNRTKIIGDLNLKNSFGNKKNTFVLNGYLNSISSDYKNLCALLPNVLGKKLPIKLSKLKTFDYRGKIELTTRKVAADFLMTTALGTIKSNLILTGIDKIETASYAGKIALNQFNIGAFLEEKKLGFTTLNIAINGQGFTQKKLNLTAVGDITSLNFNKYNYHKIKINGLIKRSIFIGKVNCNDPNLLMDFDGLVDFSKKDYKFNFDSTIDYANLHKLNFVKDTISVFRGNIKINAKGNSIENLYGLINIDQTSYQNKNDNYIFDDFILSSNFDQDKVRTITINSPDIIEGKIIGRFQFNEVKKMLENAAGSLTSNYVAHKLKKGQFLKFNFDIYNKIIDVFYPGIQFGTNTIIKGNINSDLDEFKLNFDSPSITAFDNYFKKLKINIDNKNPLYNTFIEMDSIKTKYYKIADFSLVNVTQNDTLFVRSEFKGGENAKDNFDINLFYTIDKYRNNILGIKKSEIKFKDYLWFLNENEALDNKIVFDKRFENFSFDNIILTHEQQKVVFGGAIKGADFKDLSLTLKDVDINKALPRIDKVDFNGILNGNVSFKQNGTVYQPTSTLSVDGLTINKIELGNLKLNVQGDTDFKKFNINSTLEKDKNISLLAEGSFKIQNEKTLLDLDLRFDHFNLAAISPLGGDVISNIRGLASGNTNFAGLATNPSINGRMFLDKAGLNIPYLNTDFNFAENSIIDLSDGQFIFRNNELQDTKYKTNAVLNGAIKHDLFSNWELDLSLSGDNFLALDTKDSEEALYYGKAFINGKATIFGPTNGLVVKVVATSNKGTEIKIPINSALGASTSSFIHFLTPAEKSNKAKGISSSIEKYKGLELDFDLTMNKEAEIEVILDKNSGHGMKGRGNGNLKLDINTLGKFKMTGDYSIVEGAYNFKYKGVLNKTFKVKKGSSVSWDGDPLKARLNLEAVYTANANPTVLLNNQGLNRKVPVEVAIGITGNLTNPEPDFKIDFPTLSPVLKSEITALLTDKESRERQALSILGTGGFQSNDGINQSVLATNNLYETAGNVLGGLFQNSDDKFQIGFDLVTADRSLGQATGGSIGFSVSGQINDRITLNGKVGVPVGGINESTLLGNVEIQYRVNEDGTLNLRFFNRENDINYIGEGIGFTQGVGINYEVDFNTFKQLLKKVFKDQDVEIERKIVDVTSDSEIPVEKKKSKDKKKKEISRENKEAVPPKED